MKLINYSTSADGYNDMLLIRNYYFVPTHNTLKSQIEFPTAILLVYQKRLDFKPLIINSSPVAKTPVSILI